MLTPEEWSAILVSLRVGIMALGLALPPGIALGWLLARRSFPGKLLVEAVAFLPLVLPPVVTGYLLLVVLGQNSFVGDFFSSTLGMRIIFTQGGMAVAGAVVGFPLLVRSVRLSISAVDTELEEASRTLGQGAWRTFWRVTFPLARGGILAGALLAFVRALGEFGATVMVAPNVAGTRTLALEIFRHASVPGGETAVLRLALISIVLSILALMGTEWLSRKYRRPSR